MVWKTCWNCGEKYWHPTAEECPAAAKLIEEGAKGECPTCGAPTDPTAHEREVAEVTEAAFNKWDRENPDKDFWKARQRAVKLQWDISEGRNLLVRAIAYLHGIEDAGGKYGYTMNLLKTDKILQKLSEAVVLSQSEMREKEIADHQLGVSDGWRAAAKLLNEKVVNVTIVKPSKKPDMGEWVQEMWKEADRADPRIKPPGPEDK